MEGLLKQYPELTLQSRKGTVVCSLSGHEMPGRAEVVRAYVEGKKFKKLKAEKDFNFDRLQPYIIPSQKRKRQLFCALTDSYMNRKPAEVQLHLAGRRYKLALEDYNAGRLSLFEEKLSKREGVKGNSGENVEMEVEEDGKTNGKNHKQSPVPAETSDSAHSQTLSGQRRKRSRPVAAARVTSKHISHSQKKKLRTLN